MLGEQLLPIDWMIIAGGITYVKYVLKLQKRIKLQDGSIINASRKDILKKHVLLDDNRKMKDDVTSVEVYCSHSFLAIGI